MPAAIRNTDTIRLSIKRVAHAYEAKLSFTF